MSARKAFLFMIGLLGILLVGSAAGFYFIDKSLQARSQDVSDLKADQEVVEAQLKAYRVAKQKVDELSYVNALADEVLPADKSQANAVAELNKFAKEAGVGIQTLDFSGASLETDPKLTQTTTIEGLSGVRVLPANITLREGVSYQQFISFLQKIEVNRRKMQVTSISVTPSPNDGNIFNTAALTIEIYLRG